MKGSLFCCFEGRDARPEMERKGDGFPRTRPRTEQVRPFARLVCHLPLFMAETRPLGLEPYEALFCGAMA